ncbi:hypothetical protein ACFL1I_05805 [Candidatus Omnitrophota bacterium]
MLKTILITWLCLILLGCATANPRARLNEYSLGAFGRGYEYNDYEIEIISDPPGSEIEWNDRTIGYTPIDMKLKGSYGGIYLRAYPSEPGQCLQTIYLSGSNPIPRRIYFDMKLRCY